MPTMRTVRTSRPGVTGQAEAEFPDPPPFVVAARDEPTAVARHRVHRAQTGPGDKVVVHHAFRLAPAPGAAEKVIVDVGD